MPWKMTVGNAQTPDPPNRDINRRNFILSRFSRYELEALVEGFSSQAFPSCTFVPLVVNGLANGTITAKP